NGAIAGYEHVLPGDAPGATIDQEAALALAGDYLAKQRGVDLGSLGLVDRATVARDHRADHTFSWERGGFKVDEATDRYTVTVHGDRPDGFTQFLKVPEAWSRGQQLEFNRGLVLAQVGWAVVYLLVLAVGGVGLYF